MYLIQFNIIFTFLVQCYTLFYRPLIIAYASYCILSPYFCPKSLAVFYTFISLSLLILFLPFLYEHCANSSYTFLSSCRLMSKLFAFLLCAVKGLPDPAVNKCIFLLSLFLFFSAFPSLCDLHADVPRHFGHATHRDCFNGLVKPSTIGFTIRPHAFRLPASFIQLIPVTANLLRIFRAVYLPQVDLIRY